MSLSMSRRGGEETPLRGLVVVVTRPASKGTAPAEALRRLGAQVLLAPALRLAPPHDAGPLLEAASRLETFAWVIVTSAAGVRALAEAARGRAPRRLAVVGSRTAEAAAEVGWSVRLVPERFDAEGVLEAFDRAGTPLRGARVLLPLAEGARDVLERGLAERGAEVERVIAYRSETASAEDLEEVARLVRKDRAGLLTFTSPSAARNLRAALGKEALEVPVAVIGPVTAATARALGYRVVAEADEHTMDGLVRAIERWWEGA